MPILKLLIFVKYRENNIFLWIFFFLIIYHVLETLKIINPNVFQVAKLEFGLSNILVSRIFMIKPHFHKIFDFSYILDILLTIVNIIFEIFQFNRNYTIFILYYLC